MDEQMRALVADGKMSEHAYKELVETLKDAVQLKSKAKETEEALALAQDRARIDGEKYFSLVWIARRDVDAVLADTVASANLRPMSRFASKTVFAAFVAIWLAAASPTSRSAPPNATHDGVCRLPCASATI